MNLSNHEARYALKVVHALSSGEDFHTCRQKAGQALLELFQADYFATFHWSEANRRFEDHITINMTEANLVRYERYYQFQNPISRIAQRMGRAISVNQIIEQRDLERTEFFNDFLKADGLCFGINLHVHHSGLPVADWRIWRCRKNGNFEKRSLELLDYLAPHLRDATRIAYLSRTHNSGCSTMLSVPAICAATGLSERESQIVYHALIGKADNEIAATLFLSVATVRTHLRSAYRKLHVRNRSSLCRRLWEATASR